MWGNGARVGKRCSCGDGRLRPSRDGEAERPPRNEVPTTAGGVGPHTPRAILPRMQRLLRVTSFILLLAALPLHARVVRVEITSRKDVLDGKAFGEAGAYERITGTVYFSVAVANPHNLRVVDLKNAVNLRKGEVEFSANFVALRPKD